MNIQQLVLGSIIMSRRAYEELLEQGLNISMFTGKYRDLFDGIVQAREEYQDDLIALQTIPKRGEVTSVDIAGLVDWKESESWLSYQQYFDSLCGEYLQREFKKIIAHGLSSLTYEDLFEISGKITDLATKKSGRQGSMDSIIQDVTSEVEKRHDCNFCNPFRTGYEDYDQLGHFEPGSLAIIAGQSGHGKSTFALNLAYQWILKGLRVLYVTYEMSSKICLAKLNMIRTRTPWDEVFATKGSRMDDQTYEFYVDELLWFREQPLFINEFAETPEEIELLVKRHGIDVFVIDTVNFLTPTVDQFWLALGNLAKSYKAIARRNDCLALMIAQGAAYEGRPKSKNQLAESKRMKNDADYIDFLYREEEEDPVNCHPDLKGILEIFRVKGRLTGTGKCYLKMEGDKSIVDKLDTVRIEQIHQLLGRKGARK